MNKISVAMTTYNGEKYIEKQLLSIFKQRRKVDEVIIYDDCSTDKTVEIMLKFIENNRLENWEVNINKSNIGFIKNFHQAIRKTTGNIIFLSDQDDIWDEDKVSEIERLFDENEDALAINSSFRFINAFDKEFFKPEKRNTCNNRLIFKKLPRNSLNKISELEIIKGNISPGCTVAFVDSLKKYYLENSSFIIPHDFEINIYAAKMDGLYFYNKCLMNYRIHDKNTIGFKLASSNKILDKIKKVLKDKDNAIRILKDQLKLAEFLKNNYSTSNKKVKRYIYNFRKYVYLRERELIGNHFLGWLKSWIYYPYLRPNIDAIHIFIDLIYATKFDEILK